MNHIENMTNVNELDDKELMAWIGYQESQSIQTTGYYRDSFLEYMDQGWQLRGDRLPWSKTHQNVAFDKGQVSLWGGINGHKKSMLLGQVMQNFARTKRVGIASFEMPVHSSMERLVSQAAGCVPGKGFINQWIDWSNNRIFFYDRLDSIPQKRLLGALGFMAHDCGCQHIMIDSLMKINIDKKIDGAEKRFVDILSAAAKAYKIHIHLVAHVRKPHQGGDDYRPTKFDVRGAGELTDIVDNVMLVWMDKKKEKLKNKNEFSPGAMSEAEIDYLSRPDQVLEVAKQRYGQWEDNIHLWFDSNSKQFTPDSNNQPLPLDLRKTLAPYEKPPSLL